MKAPHKALHPDCYAPGDDEREGLVDGATYVEVLMLGHLDERERALHIARALVKPLLAADADLTAQQKLRYWATLVAYLLGVAESSVGPDGRAAIVQTMRNVPASAHLAGLQ